MACACRGAGRKYLYVWTDGSASVTYPTEIQAKAKVIRSGGSYTRVDA